MCAIPDKKALKERRGRKGTLRGWKVLERWGATLKGHITGYPYVTGENHARPHKRLRIGRYNMDAPRGLHIYRYLRDARQMAHDSYLVLIVLPVTYKPKDVIAAEAPSIEGYAQVVVRKLRISQRAYDKAMKP